MSSRPSPPASSTEGEPTASSSDNATEVAATIVSLVKNRLACPENAAQDLRRLLGNSLAVDSPAERRQASLGLLIELVADDGEFVPTTTYEEIRKERLSKGEEWPAASTLSRLYGHWLAAVRAACRFWFDGGPQRVPGSHHHAVGTQPGYQPAEILSTLLAARRDLELPDGHWPSQWEYSEWAEIKRRLTRRSGKSPRIPGLKQIRKAFGGYDSAVEAAGRHFDDPR
jgi:hypothetical protein